MDIFDGRPEWHVPFITNIEVNFREVGLLSPDCYSARSEKVYSKQFTLIKFNKSNDTTWAKGMLDAVSDFLSRNSCLENRVKILELSYPNRDNYGELRVECYLHKSNKGAV